MFWKLLGKRRKEASFASCLDSVQATTRTWGLRISKWLQRKTMAFSPVRLKVYCLLFFLVFAGWNGWIIARALQHPRLPNPVRQQYLSNPITPSFRPPADPSSLAGIQQFRSWLDSLQMDSSGKKIYDSIRQQRPGLLDSLGQIQKDYSIHH